tara:strand:+ start:48169 stop:48309 length:141 start_codon:yes stop_codon:yes gene_type:complete
MDKVLKSKDFKKNRIVEIRELLHGFCNNYLNDELESYAKLLVEKGK